MKLKNHEHPITKGIHAQARKLHVKGVLTFYERVERDMLDELQKAWRSRSYKGLGT